MLQSFDVTVRPTDAPPRVARLRAWMAQEGLDGFIVPRADAYQGEYVAPCDARLAWISGFTGSAGFAAILTDSAAVFTDGRYRMQVRTQTDALTFETVDWPTGLSDWLPTMLPAGGRVGFDSVAAYRPRDGRAASAAGHRDGRRLQRRRCGARGSPRRAVRPDERLSRPLAGGATTESVAQIADALGALGLDAYVTNQPDAVAWLLNVRGTDIARTPVAQAFAVVHADASVDLVCDPSKAEPVARHLGTDVRVVPPAEFADLLSGLDGSTGFDPATCPVAVAEALPQGKPVADPIAIPKAVTARRNRRHHRGASARRRGHGALPSLARRRRPADVTEVGVARALEGFRRDTNQLRDISFETIAGSGPNGAIVHYRVDGDGPAAGGRSGHPGRFRRTISRRNHRHHAHRSADGAARRDRARLHARAAGLDRGFAGPVPARGGRVPSRRAGTRAALGGAPRLRSRHRAWRGRVPQRARGAAAAEPCLGYALATGRILSNEPGYYREGAFGIRIENLIHVVEAVRPQGGDDRDMLAFETLTWVPIDRRLIDGSLLLERRTHLARRLPRRRCRADRPRVDGADRDWLMRMTAPL